MQKKIRVTILFGGKSAEHEVSLQSAKNVYEAIDKDKYDVTLVGITKQGQWLLEDARNYLLNANDPKLIALNNSNKQIAISPTATNSDLITIEDRVSIGAVDVVFPVVHGPNIEDGTIQGMLKLLDIAFVGPSILGAALTMNKDAAKKLLRDAGIPVADFVIFEQHEKDAINYQDIVERFGSPFFVKAPTLGSSISVSKVKNPKEFDDAVALAFSYDTKVLIEKAINARELECGILGNEKPLASVVGEVITSHEFYSYEAKYIDENGAKVMIPADISEEVSQKVQDLAIKTFKALSCEGLSRVDFFLDKDTNEIYVNEINPIPGFTNISMYPKLWEASGLSYTDLIDKLITLATERHERDKKLRTDYF